MRRRFGAVLDLPNVLDVLVLFAVFAVMTFAAACHPGPVAGGVTRHVGGTISGVVSASSSATPLAGRKVTATEVGTNRQYTATTAANGGYTIQVPEGRYHLEVELQPGEAYAQRPADTKIDNSDLDPRRDFIITIKP